jgi:hypothetical protein
MPREWSKDRPTRSILTMATVLKMPGTDYERSRHNRSRSAKSLGRSPAATIEEKQTF